MGVFCLLDQDLAKKYILVFYFQVRRQWQFRIAIDQVFSLLLSQERDSSATFSFTKMKYVLTYIKATNYCIRAFQKLTSSYFRQPL
jgi:hypothetical protein